MTGRIIAQGTLFSTQPFLQAWIANYAPQARILSLPVETYDGRAGVVHGLGRESGDGTLSADFGPDGLFACPEVAAQALQVRGRGLSDTMARQRISRMKWHVRYDHEWLARRLEGTGAAAEEYWTHVLWLPASHEIAFAGFKKTRRAEIRECYRRGVEIHEASGEDDITAYLRIHEELETAKNFKVRYPAQLLRGLLAIPGAATLIVAKLECRVIGGALFFRDGDSMSYWHGAADRNFAKYVPSGALVDRGIQLAIDGGMRSFNFGASATDSLRQFKSSFGAGPACNRTFDLKANVGVIRRYSWMLGHRLGWV